MVGGDVGVGSMGVGSTGVGVGGLLGLEHAARKIAITAKRMRAMLTQSPDQSVGGPS